MGSRVHLGSSTYLDLKAYLSDPLLIRLQRGAETGPATPGRAKRPASSL
jgi:hypothetical protein